MMNYIEALGIARLLLSTGMSIEEAVGNPAVPEEFKDSIKSKLEEEKTITLRPATMIVDDSDHVDWLNEQDRSNWTYWPALRQFLLSHKNWSMSSVQSIDKETDRILSRLSSPNSTVFDKKGLVLGYVQSGKTSNYTALIAKAADAGYRLVIVLAGMDKGLRLQTQRRLKCELVGGEDNKSVPLPPLGKYWHEFTRDELEGDFDPGYANHAALQGSQPVLLVIKKNGHVLRRLMRWLESAPPEVMRTIPLLVIDDEADSASVDTKGSYQQEEQPLPDGYEEPSAINRLIRNLLSKFQKKAYVAYTATPFANMLIPFDIYDPGVQNDLYPRNFIVDLPKPSGYVGAEELFGRMDDITEESVDGYDVIRNIPDSAVLEIQELQMPEVLKKAIFSFVLAGAARAQRKGDDKFPATMLIHTNYRIVNQLITTNSISNWFTEIKDEWRYAPNSETTKNYLKNLWETDFLPIIQDNNPEQAVPFEEILPFIGIFFESIQIRTINSATGQVLDYEQEPNLKTIAIGGNKLSRGLTLEGLLISFYLRRTIMYDTLMQMGRWFGFRKDYVDLTRIYTTSELAECFSHLALVEHRLRQDIKIYEEQSLTPLQVGMRITNHPTMIVTSRLKSRFASVIRMASSYSGQVEQTIYFPLDRIEDLASQAEHNLVLVKRFFNSLGEYVSEDSGPMWQDVNAEKIIEFLGDFQIDEIARNISLPLIINYIKNQMESGELSKWTVAVRGRKQATSPELGEVDWGIPDLNIKQISRTRKHLIQSLGVITNPGDETIGLNDDEIAEAKSIAQEKNIALNRAARRVRNPKNGLLLLYPISRFSSPTTNEGTSRVPLYNDPNNPLARDLIGIAISFPESNNPQPELEYVQGSVPWSDEL